MKLKNTHGSCKKDSKIFLIALVSVSIWGTMFWISRQKSYAVGFYPIWCKSHLKYCWQFVEWIEWIPNFQSRKDSCEGIYGITVWSYPVNSFFSSHRSLLKVRYLLKRIPFPFYQISCHRSLLVWQVKIFLKVLFHLDFSSFGWDITLILSVGNVTWKNIFLKFYAKETFKIVWGLLQKL